ncbi:MAG: methyltransferase, TIGR04325 family [Okeania sp. SIO3B5]|uniref:methyltransferase, TIGR04325 family n=1 Tax=Okeania sp. SIO3B5 TaxID=2607811 RepID=UPI001401B2B9|nr:methyltransferase, TIGR04325 family [Okeania sp. SIO3B5]NEO52981.1 methyltransferase, TIGR04325 family [Okeania sp. SIO3B5]
MFWDDIKLVTEQVQKYGLREPFFDLGGLAKPTVADYNLTIKTGDQYGRYVGLAQRPFDHIDKNYVILNPENGDPGIEELPTKYTNQLGTAVCLNVIEHIENPLEVFQAFYQIMKPNSLLIISTVFLFPYHPSPRDYWRYSPECLKYLSKQAGFTILECDWRLYIPASAGILEIKTQEPQEIRSVFVTLTKGEFTATPGVIYPLPKRQSRNETANKLIELESIEIELSSLLKEASKSQDSGSGINDLKKARQQIADLILGLPTNHLETFYQAEVGKIHQKLLGSGVKDAPLDEIEKDFAREAIDKYASSDLIPEWEYVSEGWSKQDALIKGWNVEAILDVRKAQWSSLVESIQNTKPLANDYGQHNTKMAYGYVLTKTARTKDRISLLDWGGGLGEYYLISKSLLPDVEIDYHCKEVPVLCEAGRELLPEANFYENDEDCFKKNYDLVVASSSLQYSENWREVAKKLAAATDSYLYITRLPIVHQAESFVVLQRAYKYGYGTEYLGWFLNRKELLNYMGSLGMELVREFLVAERFPVSGSPETAEGRGFLFRPEKGQG